MLEALLEGLVLVLQWKALVFMLLGILLGFWVGLLPGLGGATTLALMLPFIYTMQPVEAFAKAIEDKALVAEATKASMELNFVGADVAVKVMKEMLSQPKDVVDEFSKYVKFGE